jgi:hypothetical protein
MAGSKPRLAQLEPPLGHRSLARAPGKVAGYNHRAAVSVVGRQLERRCPGSARKREQNQTEKMDLRLGAPTALARTSHDGPFFGGAELWRDERHRR